MTVKNMGHTCVRYAIKILIQYGATAPITGRGGGCWGLENPNTGCHNEGMGHKAEFTVPSSRVQKSDIPPPISLPHPLMGVVGLVIDGCIIIMHMNAF